MKQRGPRGPLSSHTAGARTPSTMATVRVVWLMCALLLVLGLRQGLAELTPTLRRWKEMQDGQLRHDGVEYFDFEATHEIFQVSVSFDLGNLRGMDPPTMLIKYGALPTTTNYDQKQLLNDTDSFFTTKIDNLRVTIPVNSWYNHWSLMSLTNFLYAWYTQIGHYFVALVGSKLFDSLTAFVGSYQSLSYFMSIWYFGCSDPTRVGTTCSQLIKPLKQIEPPLATRTSSVATTEPIYSGCVDGISSDVYFSLSIPAAEWGFTITISTVSKYELKIVAGANLRDPADIKAGNLSSTAVVQAGSGNRSVDLRIAAPRTGVWMIMVSGIVPHAASCTRGTGASFQFTPAYNRNCSSIDGAMITSSSESVPSLDLCSVSFLPLSEGRYSSSKTDFLVDADFEADKLALGFTARALAGHIARLPRRYAGTPLTVDAIVTPNIGPFQVYARVNGYATPAQFDYYFNSSDASTATASQASSGGSSSADSIVGAIQLSWQPIAQPRVGTWYILVVADGVETSESSESNNNKIDTFWSVDVVLHTRACPKASACSGQGACALTQTYQGLSYGACACDYGFGGQQCETRTLTSGFRANQIGLLIFSNLAIVPVTVVCVRRRLYLESVLFFGAGLVSAIYHACDVELFCVFPFRTLQQLDFALAFNMVMLLSVHLSGVRKQVKAGIQVFFLLSTLALAINDATSAANWVAIAALCMLQISVTFAYHFAIGSHRLRMGKLAAVKSFLFHSSNFDLRLGFLGLALWTAALTCWLASSFSNYWLLHSIWHTSAMLSAACFIAFRRNDRYQMLSPFTAIDMLSPNYNLNPVHLGIKSFVRRNSIQLSNDVETGSTVEGTRRILGHDRVHCED